MGLLDALNEPVPGSPYQPVVQHPRGWEPRIDTDKGEAVIRSDKPPEERIDWSGFLTEWGFDPEVFTIEDDRVEVRTWNAIVGQGDVRKFWYYKARIVKRHPKANIDALISEIKRHRPRKRRPPAGGSVSLVVGLADWQMGKRDAGGSQVVAGRVLELVDAVPERIRELRKIGVEVSELVVVGLGDLVEGCAGFYPNQLHTIDLDRRDQVKLVRRLLVKCLTRWVHEVENMQVVCVPGNHGENRIGKGAIATTVGDNDDVAVFEQVAEAFSMNPDTYGHIRWHIPRNDIAATIQVQDIVLGVTHGHAGNGAAGATKVWNWWQKHVMGRQPVALADVLLTGHYHYLSVVHNGPRTHIQAPPLEAGSVWFVNDHGLGTEWGTVTFTVAEGRWDRLKVLR